MTGLPSNVVATPPDAVEGVEEQAPVELTEVGAGGEERLEVGGGADAEALEPGPVEHDHVGGEGEAFACAGWRRGCRGCRGSAGQISTSASARRWVGVRRSPSASGRVAAVRAFST